MCVCDTIFVGFHFRLMVAGVFSMCKFFKNSDDGHTANCCEDPVVYQRINEEVRDWIWKKAPGVRRSIGCKRNQITSIS